MKRIINKVKKLKAGTSNVLENNRESLSIAFKDNINSGSFARLRRGEIIISREMLRYHLIEALKQEELVELDHIACTDNGVKIGLLIEKFQASIVAEIGLNVLRTVITPSKQRIIIKITNENVVGNNLAGKIISALVGTIISNLIKKAIFSMDLPIVYNHQHNIAVIELEKLPAIQNMKKPVLGSKSILDFISVLRAKHTDVGIILKCKIRPF